ncbi:MAG: TIGR03560 family F420-dependent LLM class oxidoreductase [Acidimicrobiales bacterium]
MRFSVWPSSQRSWDEVLALVVACDRTGWDGAYFADHFMPNDTAGKPVEGAMLECWAVLAALAACTNHVRLGPLVSGNLYRHPAVVAKAATTIDQISSGRFVLGLGAGWQVNEHVAYGIDLLDIKPRLDHFEEACAAISLLVNQTRANFSGAHYQLTDAPCDPKPVGGHMPILVGASGEKRSMRIAARYADEWNAWCTPDLFRHKTQVLDRHCETIGRDPKSISRSTQAMVYLSSDESWLSRHRSEESGRPILIGKPEEIVDQVAAYQAVGVDELIVPDWNMGSVERAGDTLDLFWTEVASQFR